MPHGVTLHMRNIRKSTPKLIAQAGTGANRQDRRHHKNKSDDKTIHHTGELMSRNTNGVVINPARDFRKGRRLRRELRDELAEE